MEIQMSPEVGQPYDPGRTSAEGLELTIKLFGCDLAPALAVIRRDPDPEAFAAAPVEVGVHAEGAALALARPAPPKKEAATVILVVDPTTVMLKTAFP